LLLLSTAIGAAAIGTVAQPRDEARGLDRALAVASDAQRFPADAAAEAVRLPDEWSLSRPKGAGPVWYRLRFGAAPAASSPLALYVERACGGLALRLNEELLYRDPPVAACRSPLLLQLPSALLHARDDNTLDVRVSGLPLARVASRERAAGLPSLRLDDPQRLAAAAATHRFWYEDAPKLVAVALLLLGAVLLVVGGPRARRSDLRYLGALSLVTAALSGSVWLREGTWLRLEQVEWLGVALGPFVAAFAVLFLMRHASLRARAFDAALWVQCAIVPASLALAGPERLFALASTWDVLLTLEVLIAAAAVLPRVRRLRPQGFALTAALVAVIALAGLIEIAARQGGLDASALAPWLELALPLAFIALGLRLAQAEVVALRHSDANARSLIERRVGEAAAEAERTYAQLAELRVDQVIERERKRIAADLHDDLGAKLLTIVHTSESERISTLAREALEEMRLSVRGLTGKPVRLVDALGDWRAELVARLSQANIGAQWHSPADELPQTLPARAYVQTTRILREAVSNIIKHSGAARCIVNSKVQDGDFVLTIQDNGHGIPLEVDGNLDRGHGMASMKQRAKQLQGQCLVESGPGFGTVIRLTIPL
jgi:signal transduction histidine kinase